MPGYSALVARHRPLQGAPADAAFQRPDPLLPSSCPLAYDPPSDTLT